MRYSLFGTLVAAAIAATLVGAQDERPASPAGIASAEVGENSCPGL
ncbi:MAG TPA: hypothetical protein VN736_08860 [Candidatus Limnocylindrales bacterium]|nr:hypothetical protein [Candidatus Limnocylindrales bacterium]